jgi:hypothetical protein
VNTYTEDSRRKDSDIHTYRGGSRGKDSDTPHIDDSFTPINIFVLPFTEITTPLVVETSCY